MASEKEYLSPFLASEKEYLSPFFDGRAWLLWLVAAMAPALLTKNPIYLFIAAAALAGNHLALARASPAAQPWRVFLRLGLALAAFTILVPALFSKAGETLLFTLPELHLPFSTGAPNALGLGGPVSLESVVYGLSNALALIAILLAFATFNALADHYQLLRGLPRFLSRSGAALTVAVSFVPQMITAQREIREAQALRGHRFRGLRDLLPLLVGLLAEGLERSLALAESMEARGFGLEARAGSQDAPIRRSRYRRPRWRHRDTALAATAAMSLAITSLIWGFSREVLVFYPYPRLPTPPLDPIFAASLLLPAAPSVLVLLFPPAEGESR